VNAKRKLRVALKYCGSCNPYLDFAALEMQINKLQGKLGFELVPFSETGTDAVIILCGCPRACGNREEVRASTKKALLVSGYNVAGKPVSEEGLFAAINEELAAILSSLRQ